MTPKSRQVVCDVCDGEGKVPDHDLGKLAGNQWIVEEKKTCWSCEGSGHVNADQPKEAPDVCE